MWNSYLVEEISNYINMVNYKEGYAGKQGSVTEKNRGYVDSAVMKAPLK